MAKEKIYQSASTINLDSLGDIAIMIHHLHIIDLEKSLWTKYFECGSGTLAGPYESIIKVWPAHIQLICRLEKAVATKCDLNQIEVNDDDCFQLVKKYLTELNQKKTST